MASPSPTRSLSPAHSLPRASLDSERDVLSSPKTNGVHDGDSTSDPVELLRKELRHAREEKENLATQYRNLLSKLTTMRTTLGNKLKQDAEELDRREQLIQQLQAQNDDYEATVEALKSEVLSSNEEAERATRELDVLRGRAMEENAHEAARRERDFHEVQTELERTRLERDDWERTAMQERVTADEARAALEVARREAAVERDAAQRAEDELETERTNARNLQSVLEDFQSAKDHELRQAVQGFETKLLSATQSLAEYKHRALQAEMQIEEGATNSSRVSELEKQLKEKGLLIDKLRLEAVILNDHLMEALRRLRKNSSDQSVDRRLVTNVILQFLTTPRADPKRFEMLSLLSSILSWSDEERALAGLQRGSGGGRMINTPKVRPAELDKTDETESFSKLWVEFLMTEAVSGTPAASPGSLPPSPPASMRRSVSGGGLLFGKHVPADSTPEVPSLPSRKGKEKALS
ncbi:hypothetical protein PENSPDRAFT_635152 [Peniophora sp. CONT]|nr:hypothetical protein PENSPDRAFT_635152 [Peniophora sp. CONT]